MTAYTSELFGPEAKPRHVMLDARYIRDRSSGIGRYTEHIIRHMLKLAPNLHLHLVTHPTRPAPFDHPRVTSQVFSAAPNSPLTVTHLARRIDMSNAELFHSPFNIMPGKLPIPGVFTLHDIMWLIDPAFCAANRAKRLIQGTFYQAMIPRAVAQAKQIMTVSHHSRQEIEAYFPQTKGRVHVTYNGVDPFFEPMEKHQAAKLLTKYISPTRRFVLVVGQGSPYKNHEGALDGFIKAFVQDPEVYLVLVRRFDRGTSAKMKALMQQLGSRLICLEYVTGDELRALYSQATCFLFPSLYEGFGLPPLEAMACGTPVITSNRGAPAEVCGDGAVLVNPEASEEIASELRSLFGDEKHWSSIQAKGFEHAKQFTWERSATQVLGAYEAAFSS